MNRLKRHFHHEAEPNWSSETIDEQLEALEHLTMFENDEQIVSTEGRISDFFNNKKDEIGDQLKAIIQGSGSVQQVIAKKIDILSRNARTLDRTQEFPLKYTPIAGYFYDVERQRYRFDLERALSDDVKWVKRAHALIGAIDEAIDHNLKLMGEAPILKGPQAWLHYWTDRANKQLLSAGRVFLNENLTTTSLYGSRFELPKQFNDQLIGELFTKQSAEIRFKYGKPKIASTAKRELEQEHTITQREISGYLRQCEQLAQLSAELYQTLVGFRKKYHPMNGTTVRGYVALEVRALEHLNANVYLKPLDPLFKSNAYLLRSIMSAPTRLLTRHLKLLRVIIRASDQFFD
jgi:hypothetical protein